MVDACKLLGVDIMTLHWEFTYGDKRASRKSSRRTSRAGKIDIVAQNIKTTDFGDPVFKPYVMREINGVPVAIIGQAFPYTPIANPRWHMVPDWTFGIQDDNMQKTVDEARAKGAQVVVVLSHNGMDVDLKMASRVTRHRRHPRRPHPRRRAAAGRRQECRRPDPGHQCRLQRQVPRRARLRRQGRQGQDFRYKLLPVFANLLPADKDGRADRQGARAAQGEAGRKARRLRRPALPPRQLQRQLGPADPRRADGSEGRRHRLLARLPLGHHASCPARPSPSST
jgi:sulfur-oxidizing protein SoxB